MVLSTNRQGAVPSCSNHMGITVILEAAGGTSVCHIAWYYALTAQELVGVTSPSQRGSNKPEPLPTLSHFCVLRLRRRSGCESV